MAIEGMGTGTWTDAFHQYQDEIISKIKKGTTEESIAVGAESFTQTEWENVLKNIDKQLGDVKEEQKARLEKREEKAEAVRVYEAMTGGIEKYKNEENLEQTEG